MMAPVSCQLFCSTFCVESKNEDFIVNSVHPGGMSSIYIPQIGQIFRIFILKPGATSQVAHNRGGYCYDVVLTMNHQEGTLVFSMNLPLLSYFKVGGKLNIAQLIRKGTKSRSEGSVPFTEVFIVGFCLLMP